MLKNYIAILLLIPFSVISEPLLVVTEELPPYSYLKGSTVEGVSTDIVRATLQQANLDYQIEIMTWSKAYSTARFKPNVLIYSVAKNQQRISHFRWIGEIAPFEVCFYRLKNHHIQINTLDDAKKYRVGAANGSWGEQLLISKGFVLWQNLIQSPNEAALMNALTEKIIDIWFVPKLAASQLMKSRVQNSITAIVVELCIAADEGLYMALSTSTPKEIGDKLIDSLKTIKANGKYQKILSNHHLTQP